MPGCLEKVEGDFAIACLSPKHLGQLILAKGTGSPLVYVKTKHLLVWASEGAAITRAWTEVLGSPPSFGRFEWMTEGSALLVDRDEVRSASFTPKRRKWTSTVYYSTNTKGSTRDDYPVHTRGEVRALAACSVSRPDYSLSELGGLDVAEELAAEGLGFIQCEDCSDWTSEDNIESVSTYGHSSYLCGPCADWARSHGLTADEATIASLIELDR